MASHAKTTKKKRLAKKVKLGKNRVRKTQRKLRKAGRTGALLVK